MQKPKSSILFRHLSVADIASFIPYNIRKVECPTVGTCNTQSRLTNLLQRNKHDGRMRCFKNTFIMDLGPYHLLFIPIGKFHFKVL